MKSYPNVVKENRCLSSVNAQVRQQLEARIVDVISKYRYLDEHELEFCLRMVIHKVKEGKL